MLTASSSEKLGIRSPGSSHRKNQVTSSSALSWCLLPGFGRRLDLYVNACCASLDSAGRVWNLMSMLFRSPTCRSFSLDPFYFNLVCLSLKTDTDAPFGVFFLGGQLDGESAMDIDRTGGGNHGGQGICLK